MLFPLFLKLDGRPCLVVGGGAVAEGKLKGLLEAGSRVRVVAPRVTPQIHQLAREGKILWKPRSFVPRDLNNVFLVLAATSSPRLHRQIFEEARRRGVLCNVVDDPAHCDFYYAAVVRRGPLQIAVSTEGRSPALAQRLRRELEQQFGPEYIAWVEQLGQLRRKVSAKGLSPERRRRLLHQQASPQSFARFVRRSREHNPRRHP